MNAGTYTNRGEEVPLGVECALPHCARTPMQDERPDAKATFPAWEIERGCARLPLPPRLRLVTD